MKLLQIFVMLCSSSFILINANCSNNNYQLLRKNIKSSTPAHIQENNVKQLIQRQIGEKSKHFKVFIDENLNSKKSPQDGCDIALLISSDNNQIFIMATNGVTAAWAFNYYLKHKCNSHISWAHKQLNIPNELPFVNVTLKASDLVRYYQNTCLYGYSFVWWKWSEWQQHIDWMALNGINLFLAQSGQEYIWWKTFQYFGMQPKEIQNHFTGPGFLPWNRMGNLNSWGGPLPKSWIESDRLLQHQILNRTRSLGMIPIIPGFNGIVPKRLAQLYPSVNFTKLKLWGHFSEKYSGSYLLNVSSDLVSDIGKTFIKLYIKEFGTDHFYSFDTFNEMSPPNSSLSYLQTYSQSMMNILDSVDSKSIWVMQGWMFYFDNFWTYERAKSLLSGVTQGKLLILDLTSTTSAEYKRLGNYFGHSFIYCMLHNYGGTLGLYGKINEVNKGPHEARNFTNNMVGTGITPEGIYNSYAMYEFMMESSWRTQPLQNLTQWFDLYINRRYNNKHIHIQKVQHSWHYLLQSVYNCCSALNETKKPFRFHGQSLVTNLPSLKMKHDFWYDRNKVFLAWDEIIESIIPYSKPKSCQHDSFTYDVIDISREGMANSLYDIYDDIVSSYHTNDSNKINELSNNFLEMIEDLDTLLSSCEGFLLGQWVEMAKNKSDKFPEQRLYEYNAKNQVTLWGPKGNILDYAGKQWSGLIEDYYKPRWQLFFKMLVNSLKKGTEFNHKRFKKYFLKFIGAPFTTGNKKYPIFAVGDPLEIAVYLHNKWRKKGMNVTN